MRIISQRYIGDGQFMLQLGGLSSETKPTDAFVATGSQFFEDDTDAVFTFSGLTWNLEKNGQMKDLPVVTSTDNGKVLKVANGVWSVGEDGGGEGGGGGAEKFIVTLTQESDTWTADKTIAEIVAADAANQVVVAKYPYEGMLIDIPLLSAGTFSDDGVEMSIASFATIFEGEHNTLTSITISAQGDNEDAWSVEATNTEIPTNEPLVVTLAFDDPSEPTAFVGDKTYGEVFTAASAGTPCTLVLSAGGTSVATPVLSAASSNGTIVLYTYDTDSSAITSIQGSSSDYVTISLS